jgi:hypothetical protein
MYQLGFLVVLGKRRLAPKTTNFLCRTEVFDFIVLPIVSGQLNM